MAAQPTDKTNASAPPLWQQLQVAARVLAAVSAGQSGTAALEQLEPGVRAGVQALVFHAWRNWGRALALRSQLARRPPPGPADALLCLALALGWDDAGAPYTAFTLVDQAVEAAKRGPARAQASFLNACLRRFLREKTALLALTDTDLQARWNYPAWWIEAVQRDHPECWGDILMAGNVQPAMTLRVNTRQISVASYQQALLEHGMPARAVGLAGLQLARPCPVHELPGFAQGWVSVQDAAAQLAAPLLFEGWDLTQPRRVLDACAAPGGKTAHLLELTSAHVVALDVDARRCRRIGENLQRLNLSAQTVVADAAAVQDWWPRHCASEPFDAILLDAPCTASGIVRRHPDVRWLRRPGDIAQLVHQQARLLQALWPLLKPAGRLLYCTCSVFRAEGQAQMEAFVGHNSDAIARPAPGHLLPQNGANGQAVPDNVHGENDGFFYALLEKRMP